MFNLSSTKPIYTKVHLCALTTNAKQYKKLYDSEIYNFMHEGYHKIKCINKALRYMDNQGDAGMMIYPEVHTLVSATLYCSSVDAQGSQNATKASQYSPRAFPLKWKSSIHNGTLSIVTKPAQILGQSPQLN
jgi:hypothetical protein